MAATFTPDTLVRIGSGKQVWRVGEVYEVGVMLHAPKGEAARNRWIDAADLGRLVALEAPSAAKDARHVLSGGRCVTCGEDRDWIVAQGESYRDA